MKFMKILRYFNNLIKIIKFSLVIYQHAEIYFLNEPLTLRKYLYQKILMNIKNPF